MFNTGYGRFSERGAHRVAYELTYGLIPAGLHVCHRCDNRRCVNPGHLWLGTNADNMADRNTKGRQSRQGAPRGAANGRATVSDEVVLEARRLYSLGGTSQRELARLFGVSQMTVNYWVRGRTRS